MMPNHSIPTESFFIANERVMALIAGGQLTTDHVFGLTDFFSPTKASPTLTQSTRLRLEVDGSIAECLDDGDDSRLLQRGFVGDAPAVTLQWRAGGLEVTEVYFIPPDLDGVVQRVRLKNTAERQVSARATAIVYPQFSSTEYNKKGVCRRAFFDRESEAILLEDHHGNVLAFGASEAPSEYQVGEVCGHTDVYYDLEDGLLSCHGEVAGVAPIAAIALAPVTLAPGEEAEFDLYLTRENSTDEAQSAIRRFRMERGSLWSGTEAYWQQGPEAGSLAGPSLEEFGPRLAEVERRAVMVLRSAMLPSGPPLGGMSFYRDATQTRNGSYILLTLDQLGFHDEARRGYEYYTSFKIGDDRFASADENDQLGTILHVFDRHLEITGDLEFCARHKESLFNFARRLVGLVDPGTGLIYSERAIHEFVAVSRGYETYVNVMACRGLLGAARLAASLDAPDESARFQEAAEKLRQDIMARLVHPELGIFVKRIYQGRPVPLPTISMLTPALFGIVPADHPVVSRTLDYLREHIWDRTMGGLYRYPLSLQPWPEIPYGGPWVTYTSWLARVHLLRGETEQAAQCIRWVLENLSDDSLLIPEHFSVNHTGQRGFHRIYIHPSAPEIWATAEFLRLTMEYRKARQAPEVLIS